MKPVALSAVDVSVHIKIIDATDGSPETGVTSASAGLALSYRKGQTGEVTALTESDLATVATAHADGGMIHTNAGVYRVDLPDAAVPTVEGEETWVTGVVTGMQVIPAAIVGRVVPLAPTTAGRTLDVSAGGEAGVDWANVGSPTTTVGLSGTTVKTATDVETDTADIQTRLPAALTAGGNIKADALALSGDTVAADNAEAFFDGTGYAGTNNVIPTVTTVGTLTTYTGNTPQTGDAFARIGVAGAGLTAVDDATLAAIAALNNLDAAGVRTAVGLESANLDTQLDALPTATENAAAVWTVGNLTVAAVNRIADVILRRTTANVEASSYGDTIAGRSLYGAVARLAHKVATSLGTMTVYKSDDSTSLTTATLTTDSAADPVVTVDPAA